MLSAGKVESCGVRGREAEGGGTDTCESVVTRALKPDAGGRSAGVHLHLVVSGLRNQLQGEGEGGIST